MRHASATVKSSGRHDQFAFAVLFNIQACKDEVEGKQKVEFIVVVSCAANPMKMFPRPSSLDCHNQLMKSF